MNQPQDESPRFEQDIAQLEAIIEQIESGQADLQQCLAGYEQGMKLIGRCRTMLDAAQKRIGELTLDGKGALTASDDTPGAPGSSGTAGSDAGASRSRSSQAPDPGL